MVRSLTAWEVSLLHLTLGCGDLLAEHTVGVFQQQSYVATEEQVRLERFPDASHSSAMDQPVRIVSNPCRKACRDSGTATHDTESGHLRNPRGSGRRSTSRRHGRASPRTCQVLSCKCTPCRYSARRFPPISHMGICSRSARCSPGPRTARLALPPSRVECAETNVTRVERAKPWGETAIEERLCFFGVISCCDTRRPHKRSRGPLAPLGYPC